MTRMEKSGYGRNFSTSFRRSPIRGSSLWQLRDGFSETYARALWRAARRLGSGDRHRARDEPLSFVFARIYFPTFSNGLKEIAGYLGFQWSGSPASGLEAIVWRHRWEASRDPAEKQALLDYNRQDCEALEIVANSVVRSAPRGARRAKVATKRGGPYVRNETGKPYGFKRNEFAFPALETINKAAYWDYQRERVYVKSRTKRTSAAPERHQRSIALKPKRTIDYPTTFALPGLQIKDDLSSRQEKTNLIDLKFMRHGIKRWIARYVTQRYRCRSCRRPFTPRLAAGPGNTVQISSHTQYTRISNCGSRKFLSLRHKQVVRTEHPRDMDQQIQIRSGAESYQNTYDKLLEKSLQWSLLHVDETSISIKGETVMYGS